MIYCNECSGLSPRMVKQYYESVIEWNSPAQVFLLIKFPFFQVLLYCGCLFLESLCCSSSLSCPLLFSTIISIRPMTATCIVVLYWSALWRSCDMVLLIILESWVWLHDFIVFTDVVSKFAYLLKRRRKHDTNRHFKRCRFTSVFHFTFSRARLFLSVCRGMIVIVHHST